MLMYPKEYQEFSNLVKKYVVYHILLKVLQYDRKIGKQSSFKLARAYDELLSQVQWLIEKDLVEVKRQMKRLGGMIIREEQKPTVRIVESKFRGFIYTHRFMNYLLQAESEQVFKSYVFPQNERGKLTSSVNESGGFSCFES
ncbi:hypothetical protein [Tepidibacillus sp. LV47]|uniref:hypothetical protein n=1 Tax=Tepidibacillus sp. LV47 TaxID=3398228 RepID=UPI003AADA921